MKRRGLLTVAAALVAALALQPATSMAQGGEGDPVLLIANCKKGSFKPRAVIITCADTNFRVRDLKWTKWTRSEALGSGTALVNDCVPNCYDGTFRSYPVRLRAFRTETEGGCVPFDVFTRLRWTFPGKKPKGPRSDVERTVCPPSGP